MLKVVIPIITIKQTKCPSIANWTNRLENIYDEIVLSNKKKMIFQTMKRHGGILNAYHEMKETNQKGSILYHPNYPKN